jgi:Fe-S cluster assembly protein SufB
MAEQQDKVLTDQLDTEYKYGFTTNIESDMAPKGLSEDTIRFISAKKNEPEWLLKWPF